MKMLALLGAAWLLLMAPALAQPAPQPQPDKPAPDVGHAQSGATAAYTKADEALRSVIKSIPSSGDADVDFARRIILYDRGATEIAQTELAQGKDPQLRKLARKLVAMQGREVAFLQAWLDRHGR